MHSRLCYVFVVFIIVLVVFDLALLSILVVPIRLSDSGVASRISGYFGISQDLARIIEKVSRQEGVDPYLVSALVFTESSFRSNVVSRKGYRGLAQIKYYVPYDDVNVMVGIRILKEKLRESNGDMRVALALYKGYGRTEKGMKQADKVLRLYNDLRRSGSIGSN